MSPRGRPTIATRLGAIALIAVLLVLCAGELARATMPGHSPDECAARLCDEGTGCGAPRPAAAIPALAPVPVVDITPAPVPAATAVAPTAPAAAAARRVAPPVPRSPPLPA